MFYIIAKVKFKVKVLTYNLTYNTCLITWVKRWFDSINDDFNTFKFSPLALQCG